MKTQSRILISVVSSIAISLVFALIALAILRGMSAERERSRKFDHIIDRTQSLQLLVASFKEGSGRSDIRQVREILQSLTRFFREADVAGEPRERALFEQVRMHHQELNPIIHEIIASGDVVNGIEKERRDILASQVWMKVQFIADDTHRLIGISQARISAAEEKAGGMIVLLILVLAVTNGAIYFISGRGIVRAEESLRKSEQNLSTELDAARRLQQVSTQLIQADDRKALYEKILDTAVEILHSDFASLQMLYPDHGGELRLLGYRGFTPEAAKFWNWVTPGSGSSCGVALHTGQRVVTPDVHESDFMAGSDDLKMYLQTGIRAVQTTPLLSRSGKLLGMISTHWKEPYEPSERELRALDILARQAADLLEQLQAKEALNESNERFRLAVKAAKMGAYSRNLQTGEDYWSSEFLSVYGLGPNDTLPLHEGIPAAIHPNDRELVLAQAKNRLNCTSEPEFCSEHRIILPTGDVRWVMIRGRLELDDSGRPLWSRGLVVDITDRRQAEVALLEAHQKALWLASFPDESPNPILRVSMNGSVLYRNRTARQLPGWACEVGRPLNPSLLPLIGQAISEAKTKEEDIRLENRFYSVWVTPFPKEGYTNIYGRDITDLKKAERELLASEERFRRYFELGLIGMAITTPDKGFIEVNHEICKILGYERDELMQKTWAELTHPDDLKEDLAQYNRILAGEIEGYAIDKRFIRKDGRVTHTTISIRAMRSADGSLDHFIALLQDITERKQFENRLKADLAALTGMHELSRKVLESGKLYPLLQAVMDTSVAIMDAQRGTLQLLDGDSLRIVAHHGHGRPFLEFFASAENRASACGEAMTCGERVIIPDVERSPLFVGTVSLAVLREAGVRAVQSTPLKTRAGVLLGILTTQWEAPYAPDEHDLWRIDLLARQAADMIEHSRAEEALRESEERLRLAQESGKVGVWDWYPQTGEGNFSSQMDKIYGLKEGTIRTYQDWRQRVHPDDLVQMEAERDDAIARHAQFDLEFRVFHSSGRIRWINAKGGAIYDNAGELVRVLGVNVDITERKQTEEALRQAMELARDHASRLLDTLDATPSIIWTAHDRECRSITGNRAAEEFSRVPQGANMSKTGPAPDHLEHYRVFMGGVELKPEEMPLQQVAASGKPLFNNSIDFVFADGTVRSLLGNVIPRLDDAGQSCGAIAAYMDITDRLQVEAALRRSRDELERRVRERTAELEHKTRELQEFAYVASHDLSEPLRKIQTFGDMLKAGNADNLSEKQRDYVSRMTGAAGRMQELLDALLRYSRVETHAHEMVPLKLEDVVQEVTSDLEVSISRSRGEVEVGSLPVIHADRYQMRQVFQNLIANSLKYHRSEVKPHVRIYGEEDHGDCRIFVEDNGIGFDEKYLERIFQPFQRLHGRHEYPGTGIGLAVCRKIVKRHGGTITAKSIPGKGSTFIITLPFEHKQS